MIIETQNRRENIPWVEKYRPRSVEEVLHNDHVKRTFGRYLAEHNLPNALFYGAPGTGKTSTIMATAAQFYKSYYKYMVLELNASDDRGINTIRKTIKIFAESRPPIHDNIF